MSFLLLSLGLLFLRLLLLPSCVFSYLATPFAVTYISVCGGDSCVPMFTGRARVTASPPSNVLPSPLVLVPSFSPAPPLSHHRQRVARGATVHIIGQIQRHARIVLALVHAQSVPRSMQQRAPARLGSGVQIVCARTGGRTRGSGTPAGPCGARAGGRSTRVSSTSLTHVCYPSRRPPAGPPRSSASAQQRPPPGRARPRGSVGRGQRRRTARSPGIAGGLRWPARSRGAAATHSPLPVPVGPQTRRPS